MFASNDATRPEVRVPLELTVTGEPDVQVASWFVGFGDVFVGGVGRQTVAVRNTGTAPLSVAVTSSVGSVAVEPASVVVAPGTAADVHLRWEPAAAGALSGSLTIASDDPDEASVVIGLLGMARPAPAAEVIAPSALSVRTEVGTTTTETVTLRNTGAVPLHFAVTARPAGASAPTLFVVRSGETTVRQLDAVTAEEAGRFGLPSGGTAIALAASADSVYAVAPTTSGPRAEVMYVFDRSTGTLRRSVTLAFQGTRSLAHDGETLYALAGSGYQGVLLAVDPGTGRGRGVQYDGQGSLIAQAGLAAGRGSLFLGVYNGPQNRTEIIEIDPITGTILHTLPASTVGAPATYVDGLLIVKRAGDVQAVDPDTGAEVPLGPSLWDVRLVAGWGLDVPWVEASPGSGTVAPGETRTAQVAVGTNTLAVGTYEAQLVVRTDDPRALATTIPLTLSVTLGTPAESAATAVPFAMGAPFPNPTLGRAEVAFTLPTDVPVHLDVFDTTGRLVVRLVDGRLEAGVHHVPLQSEVLPAGVYTVRLRAGDDTAVRRFIVVR